MISSAEEFRQLVLDEAQHEPNPHIVAERIVSKLAGDADALRVALACTATSWISTLIKRPHVRLEPAPTPETKTPPHVYRDGDGNRRISGKTTQIVDWYAARLAVSIKVGGSTREWKNLSACTVANLTWVVEERLSQAAKNTATAQKYQQLIDAMEKHGADTVADLPADIGKSILRD